MDEKTILTYLKKVPLFSALRETDEADLLELHYLARIAKSIEYATGDRPFQQGDAADKLYIIVRGKLRLTRYDRQGIPRFLRDVGEGEYFGETGLVIGDFHDASAEALTTTEVLYLERQEFLDLLQKRPRLRRRLKLSAEVAHRKEAPRFEWLRGDENVVYATQRHWAYLARQIFFPALALIALAAATVFASLYGAWPIAVLTGLAELSLLLAMVWVTLNWRNDHFVLTTQRVVHYEEEWPISRHLEESPLENIQDVHLVRNGLSAALFNYGDLILQTAGETVKIDLTGIPRPDEMREKIFQQIERARAQAVLQTRTRITETLEKRLRLEPITAAEADTAPSATAPRKGFLMLWAAIRDYFFPPSWTTSTNGETIIWRRFWLAGFIKYFLLMVATLFSFIEGIAALLSGDANPWQKFVWVILMLGLSSFFLWKLEDWRNDYFEITPTRFVQIERSPFMLKESRRETTLDRIQNISFTVPNLPARLFRYGTVTLETAGTQGKFELAYVRYPDRVQAEISRRQKEFRRQQASAQAEQRRDELLSWFAAYDALRKQQEGAAFDEAVRRSFPEAGETTGTGQ